MLILSLARQPNTERIALFNHQIDCEKIAKFFFWEEVNKNKHKCDAQKLTELKYQRDSS